MCIIISKVKGRKLPKDLYEEAFRCNKDGAGIAYVNDEGELVVEKGFFTLDAAYAEIQKHEQKEMIIHFRISTHGLVNKDNCHPFIHKSKDHPNYTWALAHNGTLQWKSSVNRSDTNHFVEEFLWPWFERYPWFLDEWQGRMFLEKTIGASNKFVIMRHDSKTGETKTYIVNSDAGHKAHKGCWFSNGSYIKYSGPTHGYSDYRRHNFGMDGEWGEEGHQFFSDKDWTSDGFVQDPTYKYTKCWVPVASKRGKEIVNEMNERLDKRLKENEEKDKEKDKKVIQTKLPLLAPVIPIGPKQPKSIEEQLAEIVSKNDDGSPAPDEFQKALSLIHLDTFDRKVLRRAASDFFNNYFDEGEVKGFNNGEMILWMRDLVRESFTETKSMTYKETDDWIIKQLKEGDKLFEAFMNPSADRKNKERVAQGGI